MLTDEVDYVIGVDTHRVRTLTRRLDRVRDPQLVERDERIVAARHLKPSED
jgi:hypothetical protein